MNGAVKDTMALVQYAGRNTVLQDLLIGDLLVPNPVLTEEEQDSSQERSAKESMAQATVKRLDFYSIPNVDMVSTISVVVFVHLIAQMA